MSWAKPVMTCCDDDRVLEQHEQHGAGVQGVPVDWVA
jgi:hypothetical protein